MEVDLVGYTITLKNGKKLSFTSAWGSCTGMLMAQSLVSRHDWADLRKSPAVHIEVNFEGNLNPRRAFMHFIKLLVPSAKIDGDVFSADIEGIPFDYVLCAVRLARYGNDASVTFPDGRLSDFINLLGPTKAAVMAEKSTRFNKWAFGETIGAYEYGRKLCDFTIQQSWAALISFSSKKRTRINQGLLPPLGGPDGCLGYYKDYEFFDYMMRVDREPMFYHLKGDQKQQLLNDLERIVANMDDEAVPSVDWCIMGYGTYAIAHANNKYNELNGKYSKLMDYIRDRMGGAIEIDDGEDDEWD